MPRSFDFTVDSSATVEQIHSAFAARDYWLARLGSFGGLGRLESLTVDSEGSVNAEIVTDLRQDAVAGPFAKFYPREWRIVQNETWSPTTDGRVCGDVTVLSHGAPGSGTGKALLAPTRNGSRLKCTATVEFKVPLIGGKIEGIIGRSLVENLSEIQRFTADWIADQV